MGAIEELKQIIEEAMGSMDVFELIMFKYTVDMVNMCGLDIDDAYLVWTFVDDFCEKLSNFANKTQGIGFEATFPDGALMQVYVMSNILISVGSQTLATIETESVTPEHLEAMEKLSADIAKFAVKNCITMDVGVDAKRKVLS